MEESSNDVKNQSQELNESNNSEMQTELNVQQPGENEELTSDLKIKDDRGFGEYLQAAGNAITKHACEMWVPLFEESDHYENYFIERINEMIQQVSNMEESLIQQKKELVERLNLVRQSLQIPI